MKKLEKLLSNPELTSAQISALENLKKLINPMILTASSPGWNNSAMGSAQEFWTLNTSEYPKDAVVSSLSDILEDSGSVPRRFYLSAKACVGILRRAGKRGKELPEPLARALKAVADSEPTSNLGGGLIELPIGIDGTDVGFALRAEASHSGDKGDGGVNTTMVAATLQRTYGKGYGEGEISGNLVAHSLRSEGYDGSEDGTGMGTPLVPCIAPTLVNNGKAAGSATQQDAESGMLIPEISQCVSSKWSKGSGGPSGGPSGDECQNLIAFSSKDYGADASEISPTLRALGHHESHANGGGPPAIAFKPSFLRGPKSSGHPDELAPKAGDTSPHVQTGMAVRRLTPRECERLQGFPDDYTKLNEKTADGPRYKALGNSMAVPVMRWLGGRIQLIESETK